MGQITELVDEAFDTAKSKGWFDSNVTFGEEIALCHSELSEALQEYRTCGFYGHSEKISEELADTVIRIFTLSKRHNVDLESAILNKMEVNKTREYRHGGKIL